MKENTNIIAQESKTISFIYDILHISKFVIHDDENASNG
jgi:hypothetical protein